ncbi:MAG: ribosome silencing factor [Clostridiaceae bacterium]|nr:ribosome silencing factor [Clostridiaceae bacterium]
MHLVDFKEKYDCIINTLQDKKAKDVRVIDIRQLTAIADYFIICSGTSTTHIKTLSDEVEKKLTENGVKPLRREGYNSARWILMDYEDIVVHIFHEEDREYYNLEHLWQDGKTILLDSIN